MIPKSTNVSVFVALILYAFKYHSYADFSSSIDLYTLAMP